MKFSGKNILVTGGSRGLGEALCREFAAQGARVILCCARSGGRAREIAAEIGAVARVFDIADSAAVAQAFSEIEDETGGVDILVNNARIDPYCRPPESGDGEWFDRVVGVNLKGPYLCSLAALEQMKRRGGGRIVNISSVWAYRSADRRMMEYAMTKAALHSLTRSLAGLGAPCGVTVNTVAPGLILSPEIGGRLTPEELSGKLAAIPLKRGATPAEIVGAVEFVLANSYVTGEILNINGGIYMP